MKAALLLGAGLAPLVAPAQKLQATHDPLTYHVGLTKAPLYRSAADTAAGRPSLYLPSQAEALVVGSPAPRWVVVRREGFLYLAPAAKLRDYDPADAAELPLDPTTHRITYQAVVPVPGATQAELYARARAWIAATYTQQNAVLAPADPAGGQLQLAGARPATTYVEYQGVLRSSYAGVVRHTLTLYLKDGRYKYVLSDFVHDAQHTPNLRSGGPLEQENGALHGYLGLGGRKPWNDLKVAATRDARYLLASLQEAMTLQKPAPPKAPSPKKAPDDF